jgi:hypothetical protein
LEITLGIKGVENYILKPKETMKAIFANVVDEQNTIKWFINGVISVNPVILN